MVELAYWMPYPENKPRYEGEYYVTILVDWGNGLERKWDKAYYSALHKVWQKTYRGKGMRQTYNGDVLAYYSMNKKPFTPYEGEVDINRSSVDRNDNVCESKP